MVTKMDDVSLEVRLDVGKLSRDADKADKAIRQRDKKREKDKERDEKRKRRREIRRGLTGAGGDVLRGRLPGPGRAGGRAARVAAKAAGLLAMFKGIELMATATREVPVIGAISRPISDALMGAGAEMRAGITAWEEVKDIVLGQKVAGRPVGDVGDLYERRKEIASFLQRPEVLREMLTKSETLPLMITLVKDVLLDAIASGATDFVRELIKPLKEIFFDDDEVKQEIEDRINEQLKRIATAPVGGYR